MEVWCLWNIASNTALDRLIHFELLVVVKVPQIMKNLAFVDGYDLFKEDHRRMFQLGNIP